MSRNLDSERFAVVVVSRPSSWIPSGRLDCPAMVTILDTLLPAARPRLAAAVARTYNLAPPQGRWAALKVIPRRP